MSVVTMRKSGMKQFTAITHSFYLDEHAVEQFNKSSADSFTYKIVCSKDDLQEVRHWIHGDKTKVREAVEFLKKNSEVYRHLNVEEVLDTIDKICSIEVKDTVEDP